MGSKNHTRNQLAALLGRTPKRAPYRQYLMASYAENTKAAYAADIAHFKRWGARIPSTGTQVAQYLAAHAGKLAYATLSRRLAAIHREHAERGLQSPVKTELVHATLRGIGRTYGRKQRQVMPLLREHLVKMLPHMRGVLGARDKALLLTGFLGGFRRSELAALNVEDLEFAKASVTVTVRKSKTDQSSVGRVVRIPRLHNALCAAKALERWIGMRKASAGTLFTTCGPHGAASERRMSGLAIAMAVKRRVAQIGLTSANYSGHSLRAGFVTAAAKAGASGWQIKQQTGHQSDAVLGRYIRGGMAAGADIARRIGAPLRAGRARLVALHG